MENLFSLIRHKNIIPNSLQFKIDLKLIAVSMYMKSIIAGNYDYDENESEYISDFLEYLSKSGKKDNVSSVISIIFNALATLTNNIPFFDNNAIIEYNNKKNQFI